MYWRVVGHMSRSLVVVLVVYLNRPHGTEPPVGNPHNSGDVIQYVATPRLTASRWLCSQVLLWTTVTLEQSQRPRGVCPLPVPTHTGRCVWTGWGDHVLARRVFRQACREAQQTDASSICRVLLAAAKPGDIRTLVRVRSSPATPTRFRSGSACRGTDACTDAGLSANGEA